MGAQGRSRMVPWLWPEQEGGEQGHFWRGTLGEEQVWQRERHSGLAVLGSSCLRASVVGRSEVSVKLEAVPSAGGAAE